MFKNNKVAGVDEVGRGCLAGPVFAAAVILNNKINIKGIKDSKRDRCCKALDYSIISSCISNETA